MSINKVLIAGASGNLGPAIVKELLAAKFTVSVLARVESTATFSSNISVYKTDYTESSLRSILSACHPDAVVCTLDVGLDSMSTAQLNLIKAAKAGGVKRFIPSEFGSDTANPDYPAFVPMLRHKVEAVELLKALQDDHFSWTALVTGPFFDWCIQAGFLPIDVKKRRLFKWDDGSAPFTVTNLATVGKSVVALLADSERFEITANKYVYIGSHNLTLNDFIDAVQRATPNEQWTVESQDTDDLLRVVDKQVEDGNFKAAYERVRIAVFGKHHLGYVDKSKLSNELLGLEEEAVNESLRAALGQ